MPAAKLASSSSQCPPVLGPQMLLKSVGAPEPRFVGQSGTAQCLRNICPQHLTILRPDQASFLFLFRNPHFLTVGLVCWKIPVLSASGASCFSSVCSVILTNRLVGDSLPPGSPAPDHVAVSFLLTGSGFRGFPPDFWSHGICHLFCPYRFLRLVQPFMKAVSRDMQD